LLIAVAALAANVAANLLLVPARGIVGAAVATVVTELVVTAGCVIALRMQMKSAGRRSTVVALGRAGHAAV